MIHAKSLLRKTLRGFTRRVGRALSESVALKMLPCIPLKLQPLAQVGQSEETRVIYFLHGSQFREFVESSQVLALLRQDFDAHENSTTLMQVYLNIFPEIPTKNFWLLEFSRSKSCFVIVRHEQGGFFIEQLYIDYAFDSAGNAGILQEILDCTDELQYLQVLVINHGFRRVVEDNPASLTNLIYSGRFPKLVTVALHPTLYPDKSLRKLVGISARQDDPWHDELQFQFCSVA
jgi:hypothetical protein